MDKKSAAALAKLDPELGKIIKKVGPLDFQLKKTKNPYEALIESVVYQQLTGKAAATIFGRFLAHYGGKKFPASQKILDTSVEQLRSVGLSGSKAAAIHDIARKTQEGHIPTMSVITKMPEEEIIDCLTGIRGVGRWTAEMFLIFRLGRPDVLPLNDYGIRKGFMKAFRKRKLPEPEQLAKRGKLWAPYRTTASLYLWRVLDTLDS